MFRKIVLENFKSFGNVVFDLTGPGRKPLNYALVYGENGSGKTNLIQSASFLKETADTCRCVEASKTNIAIPALNLQTLVSAARTIGSDTMRTGYEFEIDGKDVSYTMAFGKDGLEEEELRCVLEGHRGTLFRIGIDNGRIRTSFHRSLFTDATYRKECESMALRFWGKHTFLSLMNRQYIVNNRQFMDGNVPKLGPILDYIDGMSVSSRVLGNLNVNRYSFLANLERGFARTEERHALEAYGDAMNRFFTRMYPTLEHVGYNISDNGAGIEYLLFFRKKIAGRARDIPAYMESAGTRKLISLFGTLIDSAAGRTAFIDELDSGIHDKLIHDFLAETLPMTTGQIVITTHNTYLLRDADPHNVYRIAVDSDGNKDISRFSDIARTMKTHNNRERYMNGTFEGIPYPGVVDLNEISERLREDLGAQ